MAVTVLLAEDNLLVREGIARLLEASERVDLIASCDDLPSLLAAVEEHRPQVVVTDIRMPPTDSDEGIRAADEIRDRWPETGVVVLSQYDEPEYALALLAHGTARRGYILKERVSDPGQLIDAIETVAAGGSVVDPMVVETLVAARARPATSPLAALTAREREMLSEMAQGKTNAGIAAALFVTEKAVEKHIGSIFSKLGLSAEPDVHRRVKAVLLFLAEHQE